MKYNVLAIVLMMTLHARAQEQPKEKDEMPELPDFNFFIENENNTLLF
jgi:hypothetical protein